MKQCGPQTATTCRTPRFMPHGPFTATRSHIHTIRTHTGVSAHRKQALAQHHAPTYTRFTHASTDGTTHTQPRAPGPHIPHPGHSHHTVPNAAGGQQGTSRTTQRRRSVAPCAAARSTRRPPSVRPRGGCGTCAASARALFFRGLYPPREQARERPRRTPLPPRHNCQPYATIAVTEAGKPKPTTSTTSNDGMQATGRAQK